MLVSLKMQIFCRKHTNKSRLDVKMSSRRSPFPGIRDTGVVDRFDTDSVVSGI